MYMKGKRDLDNKQCIELFRKQQGSLGLSSLIFPERYAIEIQWELNTWLP